jgi:hypothetical protein
MEANDTIPLYDYYLFISLYRFRGNEKYDMYKEFYMFHHSMKKK